MISMVTVGNNIDFDGSDGDGGGGVMVPIFFLMTFLEMFAVIRNIVLMMVTIVVGR